MVGTSLEGGVGEGFGWIWIWTISRGGGGGDVASIRLLAGR